MIVWWSSIAPWMKYTIWYNKYFQDQTFNCTFKYHLQWSVRFIVLTMIYKTSSASLYKFYRYAAMNWICLLSFLFFDTDEFKELSCKISSISFSCHSYNNTLQPLTSFFFFFSKKVCAHYHFLFYWVHIDVAFV